MLTPLKEAQLGSFFMGKVILKEHIVSQNIFPPTLAGVDKT